MVSKVVIFAFVALCCAQALAAPYEDKLENAHLQTNFVKCTKSVIQAIGIVKDVATVVGDFKSIVQEAKKAKADCKAKEGATAEEIAKCTQEATATEMNKIVAESQVVAEKAANAFEKIKDVVDECS
ncbi:Zinc finger and SCAN domain-containing protein 20 [Frankliniella fusca]|uniref:Zinc finger and SCAN domain-containing protein 20 n=1 Tax=Frankliniella fusca TaxID=407009 RepID=A0AAE1HCZ2_9NEOP|nr:Zinc finger and SCAN domain-containing protein 20 [Frankliniella fusca]